MSFPKDSGGEGTRSGSRLEMVSQEFVETAFKTSCSLNPFFPLSLFLFFLPSLRTNKAFFKHHLYAKVVILIIVVLAEWKSNQMTKSPCSPRPYHLWGETNALYVVPENNGASLGVQWLRIHLPMQGTRVPSLVWEDPIYPGAAKPVCHSYWSPHTQSLYSAPGEATTVRSLHAAARE